MVVLPDVRQHVRVNARKNVLRLVLIAVQAIALANVLRLVLTLAKLRHHNTVQIVQTIVRQVVQELVQMHVKLKPHNHARIVDQIAVENVVIVANLIALVVVVWDVL